MTEFDIDFINTALPTVTYADWDTLEDPVEELTQRFEQQFAEQMRGCDSEDIGGLIVYLRAGEVAAVYDYENFVGWTV
jgi:hypothetical protein